MPQRGTTALASLLIIALLVYATLSWGAFRRSMLTFVHQVCIHDTHKWTPRPDEDPIFGISPSDVPRALKVAIVAAILLFPTCCVAGGILRWRVRCLRDRRGECVDCGHPLHTWRGRCPGCGIRIGPD